jgi:hypothetical protein
VTPSRLTISRFGAARGSADVLASQRVADDACALHARRRREALGRLVREVVTRGHVLAVGARDGVERGVSLQAHEALFGAQLVDGCVQRGLERCRFRRALAPRSGAERLHQEQGEPHPDQEASRLAERARH